MRPRATRPGRGGGLLSRSTGRGQGTKPPQNRVRPVGGPAANAVALFSQPWFLRGRRARSASLMLRKLFVPHPGSSGDFSEFATQIHSEFIALSFRIHLATVTLT